MYLLLLLLLLLLPLLAFGVVVEQWVSVGDEGTLGFLLPETVVEQVLLILEGFIVCVVSVEDVYGWCCSFFFCRGDAFMATL